MNRRELSGVGVLALAGAVLFLGPGRAAAGYGHYNPHTYQPPSVIYPFTGRYPWQQVLPSQYSRPYAYRPPSLYSPIQSSYPWWYGYRTHYDRPFPAGLVKPPKVKRPLPEPTAHITVKVPADAEIWFDDTKMTETGSVRQFYTPPLERGRDYSYQVRLRWRQEGRTVTQTREVVVTAESHITLDFTQPDRVEK